MELNLNYFNSGEVSGNKDEVNRFTVPIEENRQFNVHQFCFEIVDSVIEKIIKWDTFVFENDEVNCSLHIKKYQPLKRKLPFVSKSDVDIPKRKLSLDMIFDSVFEVELSNRSAEDLKAEKLGKIFDEVFNDKPETSPMNQYSTNCSAGCLSKSCFLEDSAQAVQATRERMSNMTKSEQHAFLLTRLNLQTELGLQSSETFVFEKKTFCSQATVTLLGLSKYMLRKVTSEHLAGQTFHIHGNAGNIYNSNKRDFAISFVLNFAKIHAENLPDRQVLRLPHYLNIKEIFSYYQQNVSKDLHLKERSFYETFKKTFGDSSRSDDFLPRIIFMPYNTHPICSTCDHIGNLRKTAKNESELNYALNCKKQHLLKVRRQYLQFCYRRELAIRFPGDYLHIGMLTVFIFMLTILT